MDLEPKLTAAQLAAFIDFAEQIVEYKSGHGGFQNAVDFAGLELEENGFIVPMDGLAHYHGHLVHGLGDPANISGMGMDTLRRTVIALFQADANENGVIYHARKSGHLSKLVERAKQLKQAL